MKPGYWSSITTKDEVRYIPRSRGQSRLNTPDPYSMSLTELLAASPFVTHPDESPSFLPIWNKEERRWTPMTPVKKRDNFFRTDLPKSSETVAPRKGCVKGSTKRRSLPPKEVRFADEDSLEDLREYITNVDGRTLYNPRFVGQANYPRDKQKDIFSEPTDFQTLDRNYIARYQAVYEWCRRERNEDLRRGATTDSDSPGGDRLPVQHLYGSRKHTLSLLEDLPMTVELKDIYGRITKRHPVVYPWTVADTRVGRRSGSCCRGYRRPSGNDPVVGLKMTPRRSSKHIWPGGRRRWTKSPRRYNR